ncbi:MAG: hypothetical protein FWG63_01495 [Defluviitaleaceae bacterium]|nr:hypothetical protein [Defluviitaleaceae bacterium]
MWALDFKIETKVPRTTKYVNHHVIEKVTDNQEVVIDFYTTIPNLDTADVTDTPRHNFDDDEAVWVCRNTV